MKHSKRRIALLSVAAMMVSGTWAFWTLRTVEKKGGRAKRRTAGDSC